MLWISSLGSCVVDIFIRAVCCGYLQWGCVLWISSLGLCVVDIFIRAVLWLSSLVMIMCEFWISSLGLCVVNISTGVMCFGYFQWGCVFWTSSMGL